MNQEKRALIKRIIVEVCLVIGVILVIRGAAAGNITPPASVSTTMKTASEVYDSLVGTSFDSSGLSASLDGDALQVAKCLVNKINGSPCP